jgi:hypothetical protein
MPRKMARQTLERHAGACYAGSRPYLGSGLLGSPANRYNLPHFRVHPRNPGLYTHHAVASRSLPRLLRTLPAQSSREAARWGPAPQSFSGFYYRTRVLR